MTVDPKGRLIASDQYGKLYRVRSPRLTPRGTSASKPSMCRSARPGMLWAFDSLYLVVNRGRRYKAGSIAF